MEALPFVGQLVGPSSSALVPVGELDTLLETYDRDRLVVPSPVDMWQWGFTRSAEMWNGRLAMIAILSIIAIEIQTGTSILRYLIVDSAH